MFKFLLLFSLFVYVKSDCSPAKYAECDQSIYECCDAIFKKAIGISSDVCEGPTSKDPECVQTALDLAFYDQGSKGVFTVCDAFSAFRLCIQPAFQSCTNRKWYLENGWNVHDASSVQSLYASLGYACGAGLDSFLRNEDCLVSTYDKYFRELFLCSLKFTENVKNDPGNGCRYLKEYSGCYKLAFLECNGESSWWSCEKVRTYGTGLVHSCAVDCSDQNDFK